MATPTPALTPAPTDAAMRAAWARLCAHHTQRTQGCAPALPPFDEAMGDAIYRHLIRIAARVDRLRVHAAALATPSTSSTTSPPTARAPQVPRHPPMADAKRRAANDFDE